MEYNRQDRITRAGYNQQIRTDAHVVDADYQTILYEGANGLSHKVVRLGINPMIQPEPEDLPKDNPIPEDNPKLKIAVISMIGENCIGNNADKIEHTGTITTRWNPALSHAFKPSSW
ncbi:hypothetical protein Tco_1219134 [Tanacetum coccineum]